jgi:transposase InsO family protein
MAAAQGVQTTSKYILPFSPNFGTVLGVLYQDRLSDKAKRKLKSYQIYQMKKLNMKEIGDIMGVHKSTISRWIAEVKKAKQIRRYQYLEPKSTRPHNTPRDKKITPNVEKLILDIRREFKCGKDNISRYLKRDYDIKIHSSTIGRYLKKLPPGKDPKLWDKNKVKGRKRKKRKKIRLKDVVDKTEGRAFEHFQIDTKYWVINGRTFYLITAIDLMTRMIFARAYSRHTSRCAKDFLERLNYVFSLQNSKTYIQRDNGTEFMGDFEALAKKYEVTLITNYVKCPEMNGYVERLNRTLKNELLEYIMPDTVVEANKGIRDYIIKYNFDRMHSGIDHKTPFEKFCELKIKKPLEKIIETQLGLLQMYRTSTFS